MEDKFFEIQKDDFNLFLRESFVGRNIIESYFIGNSLSIVSDSWSLEIHPSWRFLIDSNIHIGSADIGWEDDSLDDQDRLMNIKLSEVVKSIIGSKIHFVSFSDFNDVSIRIGETIVIQNFHSNTSEMGNIIIRDSDMNTQYYLNGKHFMRRL